MNLLFSEMWDGAPGRLLANLIQEQILLDFFPVLPRLGVTEILELLTESWERKKEIYEDKFFSKFFLLIPYHSNSYFGKFIFCGASENQSSLGKHILNAQNNVCHSPIHFLP